MAVLTRKPKPNKAPRTDGAARPPKGEAGTAAAAKRPRRQRIGEFLKSKRRAIVFVSGVLVSLLSVAGFYLTSEAVDDRVPVLVAAVDIPRGSVVSASQFGSTLADIGAIPHIGWTPDAAFAFDGWIAAQPIAAGSPVLPQMFLVPEYGPVGDELELLVPLDTSLATTEVNQGDLVLLIDPGAPPSETGPGRPRTVLDTMTLNDFDGSSVRLLLAPEQWGEWRARLRSLGASPMVLPVNVGGDLLEGGPEQWARRLEQVWHAEWQQALAELPAAEPVPEAGPGQVEFIIDLDTSLSSSEITEGDRVLLIDPGAEPAGNDPGRPRSVLQVIDLDNYRDGQLRMFLAPEEWLQWRSLPAELGAAPMILPIAAGTDETDFVDRLDQQWRLAHDRALQQATGAVAADAG